MDISGAARLQDIGEKELLKRLVIPITRRQRGTALVGDDCATVEVPSGYDVCLTTDRVPWDLIPFRLGLMTDEQLARYLVAINVSDLAAVGAEPAGLLLNLGFPGDYPLDRFECFINSAAAAAEEWRCPLIGGDLSESEAPTLTGTVVGVVPRGEAIGRSTARPGDAVFTSNRVGLAAAAIKYFLDAKPVGNTLRHDDESMLLSTFVDPRPMLDLGRRLRASRLVSSLIDNTDGIGRSLRHIAELSNVGIMLYESALPIHGMARKVATLIEEDPILLALGAGGDLQLLGTCCGSGTVDGELTTVGKVVRGVGVAIQKKDGGVQRLPDMGWNYFVPGEQ